jgi:hypothetical protein
VLKKKFANKNQLMEEVVGVVVQEEILEIIQEEEEERYQRIQRSLKLS